MTREGQLRRAEATRRTLIDAAVARHQRNQLDDAEPLYDKLLELFPDDVNVLHFQGVLQHQRGRSDRGIETILKALEIDPGYVDAHNNLGNVYKELGRLHDAAEQYRKVLELDDTHAGAHNNLGATLGHLDELDASIAEYRRALELDPDQADIWVNLGKVLGRSDETEESLTSFRKAIELKPMHAEAHLNLGRALHFAGRDEEAATVYRTWLERYPNNPIAEHMLAALTGEAVPGRASEAFIQATFDPFAANFDEKLERLGYRAPQLLAAALDHARGSARDKCDVLDAGCGTGLCGPLIRGHARHLIGVDLSERMLDKARGRDVYDSLEQAELADYMASHPDAFDVVLSADTLVYFGALEEVFAAAAAALRPGGLLVFTVEAAEDLESGYRLNPHGRYSHSREYLEEGLSAAGCPVVRIDSGVLRKESRANVAGFIVTARNAS